MARHYSTRDFFRQMPNALLARYFQDKGLFVDLDFTAMKEGKPDELFSAWLALTDGRRRAMDVELQEIFEMSCEKGFRAVIDEANWHLLGSREDLTTFVEKLSVIDCHSRYAFGRLYTTKLPVTAVHVLNEDVLPFFEKHDCRIETVLSDNEREFCGRPNQHPYELFLQLEEIEHRTTRVRRPPSNGFVERLHKTLLEEHFRIAGRSRWYEDVSEMQEDLEAFLKIYNHERTHQGRNMQGRTPYQAFLDGLPVTTEPATEEPLAA